MDRDEIRSKPDTPDLPAYVLDPLEKQSPERLEKVAAYAVELATWKRAHRETERKKKEAVDPESLEELQERDISTDPDDYKDVPTSGSYITIKETKPGYHYYYWQWRDGNSWKNEYIAPVSEGE